MQARICAAHYAGRFSFFNLAYDAGASSCRYVTVAHITAGWLQFRDHLHLTIAGSDDILDWTANISASQTDHGGLQAHRGWVRSAEYLRAELRRHDLQRELRDRALIIGGHSAGGAMAELLSNGEKAFAIPVPDGEGQKPAKRVKRK